MSIGPYLSFHVSSRRNRAIAVPGAPTINPRNEAWRRAPVVPCKRAAGDKLPDNFCRLNQNVRLWWWHAPSEPLGLDTNSLTRRARFGRHGQEVMQGGVSPPCLAKSYAVFFTATG